jgi:hypothetical protein
MNDSAPFDLTHWRPRYGHNALENHRGAERDCGVNDLLHIGRRQLPLSEGVADERDGALDVLQSSLDALGITLFGDLLQSSHTVPRGIFWEDSSREKCKKLLVLLATPAGFEPATFSLEGCCSIP